MKTYTGKYVGRNTNKTAISRWRTSLALFTLSFLAVAVLSGCGGGESGSTKSSSNVNKLPNGNRNASPGPLLETIRASNQSGVPMSVSIVPLEEFRTGEDGDYTDEQFSNIVLPLYEAGDYAGFYFIRCELKYEDGNSSDWYSAFILPEKDGYWESVNVTQ